MENDPLNRTIPSWKLEIIKKRQNRQTCASFSCYDRSNPRIIKNEDKSTNSPSVKTKDIINFFNKSTDVARVNLSSSRSFSSGHQCRLVTVSRTNREPGFNQRDSERGMFDSSSDRQARQEQDQVSTLPVSDQQLTTRHDTHTRHHCHLVPLSRGLADTRVTLPVDHNNCHRSLKTSKTRLDFLLGRAPNRIFG